MAKRKPKPVPIDELTRQTRAIVRETHGKLETTEREIEDITTSIACSQSAIESSTRLLRNQTLSSSEVGTRPTRKLRQRIRIEIYSL